MTEDFKIGFCCRCRRAGLSAERTEALLKKAETQPMTPDQLKKLYSVLKYRVLNKETNRPFFNTNRKAFDHWHLLSPEQIRKHKIGICWDTAAMTDSELSAAGVPHENYFSHAKDLNRPTHAFNVYRDGNGEWRWIEGSWGKYKDNDWHERRKRDLVRRIVKALETEGFDEETGGDRQTLHKIDKFPEAGVNGHQFFKAMLSAPVKKAEYRLKDDPSFEDANKVFNRLAFEDRANLVPRHPDFLRDVPNDMLFDRQVAVDENGNPVGFSEFYSRKDKAGRRLPPHNIVAVAPEARGNGLARLMTEATIRKARKEKIKRLVWEAFADNEPSIRAALSAGFEDRTPKNAKIYRKFVYKVPAQAEKKAADTASDFDFPGLDLEKMKAEHETRLKAAKDMEKTLKFGDRVRVVDNIRCRQKGKSGILIGVPKGRDEKTGHGDRLYYIKFDDPEFGVMGFTSYYFTKE